jgi:hypothetical protein
LCIQEEIRRAVLPLETIQEEIQRSILPMLQMQDEVRRSMLPTVTMFEGIRQPRPLAETAAPTARPTTTVAEEPTVRSETLVAVPLADRGTATTDKPAPMAPTPRRRPSRRRRNWLAVVNRRMARLEARFELWEARWFLTQLEPPHPEDDAPDTGE